MKGNVRVRERGMVRIGVQDCRKRKRREGVGGEEE